SKVPRDLETICGKCLQKQSAKRYATALALAEDLRRYLDGEPIKARPVGVVERGWRWCRRKPAQAGLIAAMTLIVVASVTGPLWYFQDQAGRERDRQAQASQVEQKRQLAEYSIRQAFEQAAQT